MSARIFLLIALAMGGLAFAGASLAEENRIDCFEACDTKMMGCLKVCPQDANGDFDRDCRNACAIDTFHPCLDRCPHPRTGLTPAQKRAMQKLEQDAKDAASQ